MSEQSIIVQRLEVAVVEATVALIFTIEAEQLASLKAGEPVVAIAAFEEHGHAISVSRALDKAVEDAAQARERQRGNVETMPSGKRRHGTNRRSTR